jgi:hypothetical protein
MAALEFGPLRKKVRKVAAPRSRVFPRTMSLRFCRVENGLDATSQLGGGFGFCDPERLQDRQDGFCVDISSTGRARSAAAPSVRLQRHCSRCFSFRHSFVLASNSASAISPNVGFFAEARLPSRRTSIGLRPDRRIWRASSRAARASASPTPASSEPNPISGRPPRQEKR